MASPVRTISLPSGDQIPVLGQGTWGLAERRARRNSEVAALRRGLDMGMNLIDTAEMYADGDAEEWSARPSRAGAMRCSWSARSAAPRHPRGTVRPARAACGA